MMNDASKGQVFEIRSILDAQASERASAAVQAAKREAIRTLAVLEFRSLLNGRK